ncbi:hypothetical protein AeRB84_012387 [Aphanomyces euteiches]|nr:hypothetical protein AeRB84_012387 [Aphanomyces euteiches]
MASVITTQAAIESIEDVVKWGLRHIPTANPAHQATLQVACAAMELCLKFRINKEDVLATGEMIARITRSIVFQGVPDDQVIHLDDLTTALANTRVYLEETIESTKGWNILMDKSQRETHAKSIASRMMQYQDDIQRTACFLQVDFDIQIVGSVDDLMQDMQAMMDKLGKMDYYINLAQNNGALNRQVDNLLEMAIQLQRGLDHYHKNVNLRNVKSSPNFEASVLASFDKVIHAVKDSWRASKIAHDLPLDEMLEEWMLASEDVVYDPNNKSTFLGQGASAMVYLGQYKGRSVAVKHFHTLKLADSTEFETMIRKEIKAWRDVSNERYILTLIGVCTKIASPIVVCEYCPDTITRYIRLHPEKLIEMVYQFALGLLSLHNAGIIHRDIKGGNVLVREDGTVAIADFGLSRSTESLLTQYSNVGRFVGTLNWMSPEQRFSPRKVTVQSDVWSFGMTVWQLVARDIPYRDYCQEEIEEAIQSENNRPGRPEELAKDYESLWDLITWCWKLNPLERPESRDIVSFLEERYGEKLNTPRKVKNMEEPATADTIESEDDAESLDVKINIEYRGKSGKMSAFSPIAKHRSDSRIKNPSDSRATLNNPSDVKLSGKSAIESNGDVKISVMSASRPSKQIPSRSYKVTKSSDVIMSASTSKPQAITMPKPSIFERISEVFFGNKKKLPKDTSFQSKEPQFKESRFQSNKPLSRGSRFPSSTMIENDKNGALSFPELEIFRISVSDLTLESAIESGSMSEMWRGKYLGERVAIKKLRSHNATPFELKAFVQNIQLMSQFDSPFIVQFVGAAWTGPEDLMCVMEWMDGGDLRGKMSATTSETFSWRAKYEIIYHIVEGLVHLHSMNVIHRDVKSRNIMLDSSKPAKLMDVSTSKDHIEVTMTFAVGTFRWMAPEVILDQAYTASADIYSFGVVLSEIDTHQVPYQDKVHPATGRRLVDPSIILQVARGTLHPTFSQQCPEWIHSMAMQCLAFDPMKRPTALELANIVRSKMMGLRVSLPETRMG